MDTTENHQQDGAVHTISDDTTDQPHILLKASDSQSKYVQSLEERLAELERRFEELVREQTVTETASEAGLSDTSKASHASGEDDKGRTENATNGGDARGPSRKDKGEDEENEEKKPRVIIPRVRKLNYINFSNRFPFQTEIPAVEVLMINTTMEAAREEDGVWTPQTPAEDPEKGLRDMLEKNPYKPDAWMARIRINSRPLIAEVMKILAASENSFYDNVTFIHPFDPLVDSHDKLKEHLREMQEALATQQSETQVASNIESNDTADVTEETHAPKMKPTELVTLMELFLEFVESDVLPFPPKNHTKLRFQSLSSIFKLGSTLVVPNADKGLKSGPDTLIYGRDQRLWRLYRIKREWHDEDSHLILKAYSIDYDGNNYIGQKGTFEIEPYDGEQEISSLPIFPLQYHENAEQIRAEMRAQGENFVKYQHGLATHQGWGAGFEAGGNSQLQHVTGDVVVDIAEAGSRHSEFTTSWSFPEYLPKDPRRHEYSTWEWRVVDGKPRAESSTDEDSRIWANEHSRLQKITYCSDIDPFLSHHLNNKDKKYQLQERDLELLPRRVFAYVLQKRTFMALDINNLEPIKINEIKLIIDPHHRLMLDGLIGSHFQKKLLRETHGAYDIDQDFIANKGRGLIILLYGVPGVGKTSTAEQIAHFWHKPLLPVTCGNLGTDANEVENKLKDIFRLGKKWDCILLMDEADVFLSERTPMALERNALVSVFLRELEYFDGILFLTTNLPGGIDEAFKSRIHIALYYPHLNEKDTRAIWKVNMDRLKSIEERRASLNNEPPLSINEKGIRKYAKAHFRNNQDGKGRWNGRQIRNAFLIASALAQFERANHDRRVTTTSDPELDDPAFDVNPRHFDIVANASLGFEEYLAEAKGRLASEIMFQRGQRADYIRSLSEQSEESLLTKNVHHRQAKQDSQVLSNPPDPFRSQRGWSEDPTGPYGHQNPMEDQNWNLRAGNPYGGHQRHGAATHQGRSLQTPQQDPKMRSTPNLGGSAQPRRDGGYQGLPSPFQHNYQNNHPGGRMAANPDSESDDDA